MNLFHCVTAPFLQVAQSTSAFLRGQQISSSSRKDLSHLIALGCFPVSSSQKQLETNPITQLLFLFFFFFLRCFLLQCQTAGIGLKESKFFSPAKLMLPSTTGWTTTLCWRDFPPSTWTSCWLRQPLCVRSCVSIIWLHPYGLSQSSCWKCHSWPTLDICSHAHVVMTISLANLYLKHGIHPLKFFRSYLLQSNKRKKTLEKKSPTVLLFMLTVMLCSELLRCLELKLLEGADLN